MLWRTEARDHREPERDGPPWLLKSPRWASLRIEGKIRLF